MNARAQLVARLPTDTGTDFRWYLRRLSVMSGAEVAHRLAEAALLQYLRIERRVRFESTAARDVRRYSFCTAVDAQLPRLDIEFRPTDEDIARLLDANWGALGYPWRWTGDESWHLAPDTGTHWLRAFFGALAYRPGNSHGDARAVWEPSRLQVLFDLALLSQHDERHAARAVSLLRQMLASWIRGNPYLTGIHYVSTMECALRLIAVSHALDAARPSLSEATDTWAGYIWLVESHAALIRRRLSRHSSAGNHTIAECAGLIYAGLLLREHRQAADWLTTGLAVLQTEAARQVLPDGGGAEQSPWYQLFIVDLLGLVERLLCARRRVVPPSIATAAMRGRKFLAAFGDAPADLPLIGDSDDGHALSRYVRISFTREPSPRPALTQFPNAGYTILRRESAPSVRAIVDHGPIGMRPSCGHGHADALAVIASFDAKPLLIDPGTYSYNAGAAWRRYFRSTRAHNTVTVDGLDQAEQRGAFLWSDPYEVGLESASSADAQSLGLLAKHTGYAKRLGITHWRAVTVTATGQLVVWDRLTGEGEHEFELNWHLGQQPMAVNLDSGLLRFDEGRFMRCIGGTCTLLCGESDPPTGWRSERYGCKEPAPVLRVRHRGRPPHEFVTFVGPNAEPADLETLLDHLRRVAGVTT